MSNFEIQVSVDNAGTLLYSNYNITENILLSLNRVQPIADAWKMPPDSSVIVEGFAEGKDSKKGRVESYLIVNKDNNNTNNIVKPNDSSAGKESSGKSPITSDGNLIAYILLLVASGTIIALKKKKSTIR